MLLKLRGFQYVLPFLLGFWGVAFFSYLGWKPSFAYNAQRYFEILLLGSVLCAGVTMPVRFYWGRFWAVSCYILLSVMLIVIWQANHRWLAVREGIQYLALFGAILVVAKVREHAGRASFDRAAVIGVVLFCFGCSLIVLEGLLLSLSIGSVDQRIIFGAFVNVRIFSELQFLTLFFLSAAWFQIDSTKWRFFVFVTSVLWWGLLFFSGTRSALIALPFALLLSGLFGGVKVQGWFKVMGAQVVGGILFFLLLRAIIAVALSAPFWGAGGMSFARMSTSGRLDLWADSWSYFTQNPWVGYGPGGFACFTNKLVAGPHNLFFQLLSEWGIFMTLLCFALAFIMFLSLVRYFRSHSDASPLSFSLFATLVVVVTASMMQGMIVSPLQQMLIVLCFGWALHVFAAEKFSTPIVSTSSWCRLLYVGCLVLFLVGVLWGVQRDLALQQKLLVSPDGTVNLSYGPRFWADGHDRCPGWHERYGNK